MVESSSKRVVIVGGGFAGLNAAKRLSRVRGVEVTLLDRRNHHLFQPLLYQVATAGLSPADIAQPIRSVLSSCRNVRVLQAEVRNIDRAAHRVETDSGSFDFDYLLMACGASHSYFGRNDWAPFAPGLKSIEQATEIRRRILTAFESAERANDDPRERARQLTFVVVGAGPTGVELAGTIGEMSRFTLTEDFRSINSKQTRVFLIEAGPRILPMFEQKLADRAARDLEGLGVQVWTSKRVTGIDADGVEIGDERIEAATVLWAAGVEASPLGQCLESELDRQGRVVVGPDLSLPGHPEIFVAGDQASAVGEDGRPLPGLAPVAVQQGRFVAEVIEGDLAGKPRPTYRYVDKGQMATIGRNRAILESGPLRLTGFSAWAAWLVVHIYYLTGFKNRLLVVLQWAWSYLTYRRGARLIVGEHETLTDGEDRSD